MARKKKHEKEPNHERWLVSYADFITLLFAVFVTLYAMSQTDKKKVEEVMASLRESFGYSKLSLGDKPTVIDTAPLMIVPSLKPEIAAVQRPRYAGKAKGGGAGWGKGKATENDFRSLKAAIDAFIARQGAQGKVSVDITRRGLVVSLKEAGFFDSGSATVKQSSLELLDTVARALAEYGNAIRVEGHTDTVPISTAQFRSNWELSTARATNVVHYLINRHQYDPGNISVAGYGEHRPVADNGTAEGRQKNRRVDIVLLSESGERGEP